MNNCELLMLPSHGRGHEFESRRVLLRSFGLQVKRKAVIRTWATSRACVQQLCSNAVHRLMNSFRPACSYGGRKSHRAVSALAYSVGATAPAYSNGQKSYGDDGFSSSVSLFEITDGLGDLATNTPPARRFLSGPVSIICLSPLYERPVHLLLPASAVAPCIHRAAEKAHILGN